MPGATRDEKRTNVRLLFTSMAGVVTMTRIIAEPKRREERLMEARKFFIASFAAG
jgi:hypothetical protein